MTINTNVHFTCISEQSIMQALVDVDYAPIYRPGNQRLSIVALETGCRFNSPWIGIQEETDDLY